MRHLISIEDLDREGIERIVAQVAEACTPAESRRELSRRPPSFRRGCFEGASCCKHRLSAVKLKRRFGAGSFDCS